MRQINRRKSNKSLITCVHQRDPGELSNSPNGPNPHLKYHLQLKTKEDVGGSGLGFIRGGGNSHRDRKANVARPCRDSGTQRGILTDFARFLSVYHT